MTETIKDQIVDAIAEGEVDQEQVSRLVRAFDLWEQAREYRKKEAKRCNELLAARIAQFSEAMHVGHSSTSDQVLKLSVVETRWQDLEDAREERKQVGSACRDAVKSAEQKIRDLLGEMKQKNQLDLFQSAAEAAADAGVDADAGQDPWPSKDESESEADRRE